MDMLLADPEEVRRAREASLRWPSHELTFDQLADLELLLLGALRPLDGYLDDAQAQSVCATGALPDGRVVAAALQLTVPDLLRAQLSPGAVLGLRDAEGVLLAGVEVAEVAEVAGSGHVSGRVVGLTLPAHADFRGLRRAPAELQTDLRARGWRRVAAVVPSGPLLPSDLAAARLAVPDADGLLVITSTRPEHAHDDGHFPRARLHRAALAGRTDAVQVLLPVPAVLDTAVNAGVVAPTSAPATPAGALSLTAAAGAACGATALVVDDETAGLADPLPSGFGVDVVAMPAVGFDAHRRRWTAGAGLRFSRAELERALDMGREMPNWAVPPDLARQLRRDYPPRHLRGVTVLFTGLSGSGKSTIASVLNALLKERGDRHVTFLDGDVVRTHLSKGLGFSRADRDANVRRIGFVAAQVTAAGGVAICAPIAPYDDTRRDVRRMVAATGGFVLVHVATALEVCAARDRKGLYAKARQGLIPEFTGISDPYEAPHDAELTLDTEELSAEDAAHGVLDYLEQEGWLRRNRPEVA
ncbi:MAG: adenylyl-sulfate kinase [Frankiaceae bacterium]